MIWVLNFHSFLSQLTNSCYNRRLKVPLTTAFGTPGTPDFSFSRFNQLQHWSRQGFRNTLRANISETGLVLLINEQKGEKEEIRDDREFSWCCSFPWGFGCRGTERRLASWRAAAECVR